MCVSIYFLGKLARTTHCLRFYHHLSVSGLWTRQVLHLKETEVKRGETVSLDPIEGADQEKKQKTEKNTFSCFLYQAF